ncbi:MAG: rhodanese-like domain-containing protein [Chloroflexota bacterium]
MATTLTRKALQKKLQRHEPVVLVDLLPSVDYSYAHLPGAINIPYTQVDELAPRLLPNRQQAVVLYYANAFYPVPHAVATRLERMGYSNVMEYSGGKQEWMMAGLPMESHIHGRAHSRLR